MAGGGATVRKGAGRNGERGKGVRRIASQGNESHTSEAAVKPVEPSRLPRAAAVIPRPGESASLILTEPPFTMIDAIEMRVHGSAHTPEDIGMHTVRMRGSFALTPAVPS
jgi:hypothetical protein